MAKLGSSKALLIFARYPRLGTVKTRLRASLDDQAILEVYQAFLLDTLDWTARLSARRFLYLADCSPDEMSQLAADPFSQLELRIQAGRDLGERMWNAGREVSADCSRIVYLGVDTPSLPPRLVEQAFSELTRFPVVIGPSGDGGYYLLGLSAPQRELFQDIPWGTSRVLETSLAKLKPGEVYLLPTRDDVDTPGDLERLDAELAAQPDRARHTRAVLQRLVARASLPVILHRGGEAGDVE